MYFPSFLHCICIRQQFYYALGIHPDDTFLTSLTLTLFLALLWLNSILDCILITFTISYIRLCIHYSGTLKSNQISIPLFKVCFRRRRRRIIIKLSSLHFRDKITCLCLQSTEIDRTEPVEAARQMRPSAEKDLMEWIITLNYGDWTQKKKKKSKM